MSAETPRTTHTQWTEDEARAMVLEIVADVSPTKAVPSREARLVEDLGYHSLALLELAFALEDEFSLPTIDEAAARAIRTVADVERHVLTRLPALAPASSR